MSWVNGHKQNSIAVTDRGLAYGDGLFETIACINKQLHLWSRHWHRIQQGAERLGLVIPGQQTFLDWIDKALSEQLEPVSCVVKIIITRGTGGRGYRGPETPRTQTIINVYPWPERADKDYRRGIKAMVCQTVLGLQPQLAGIKHLNRLEQVLAARELSDKGCQEGIMLESSSMQSACRDIVVEGVSSNLFFVHQGLLHTPEITQCGVSGTMRNEVIHYARTLQREVKTGRFTLEEVLNAEEVFFTNSIFGILPVQQIIKPDNLDNNKETQVRCYPRRDIAMQLAKRLNQELQRPCQFDTL